VTPLPNYGNALLLLRVGPRRPIASGTPPNRFPTGAIYNAAPGPRVFSLRNKPSRGPRSSGKGREREKRRERGGGKSKGRAAQGRRERIREVSPPGLS